MTVQNHPDRGQAAILSREAASDLLERYPRVSADEAKLLVHFLRKGRHLDVGILTGDEKLKPHLDMFMADHARHFRVGVGETSAAVAAIAAFLAMCWVVWETIKPAALAV